MELIERILGHIRDVDIADFAAADFGDIRSVGLDPLTVKQIFLVGGRNGLDDHLAFVCSIDR